MRLDTTEARADWEPDPVKGERLVVSLSASVGVWTGMTAGYVAPVGSEWAWQCGSLRPGMTPTRELAKAAVEAVLTLTPDVPRGVKRLPDGYVLAFWFDGDRLAKARVVRVANDVPDAGLPTKIPDLWPADLMPGAPADGSEDR